MEKTTSETKVQVAKTTDKYFVSTLFTQNREAFDYRRTGAIKERIS